jgi:tetratricopeptide (TPR) repeat protein
MAAPRDAEICNSLEPLRDLLSSLKEAAEGRVPTGSERKRLLRRLRIAGNSAVPSLVRALSSTVEDEAAWAYYLLGRLGGDRVVQRVHRLLGDNEVGDEAKARALGLLSDLDAPLPHGVSLKDPDALLSRSVRELMSSLDSDEELDQAVDLIMSQVPDAEVPGFAAEVMRHGGKRARPLLEQLMARPQLSADTRRELDGLVKQAQTSRAERAALAALDRGLAYLEAGRPRAARRRLSRFVSMHGQHAEGRSALGVCLLELSEIEAALEHLHEAARLEPEEALHRWNLAAAAKQSERMGGAYLALREYLKLSDESEGAAERHKEARSFVRAYERMLRESHPGVPLSDVLRGEELFARAYAALSEGRPADARHGFEEVLELVPRHYPSWGNLGAAYLAMEEREEALRCFRRALELNPDYAVARQNLALLEKQS